MQEELNSFERNQVWSLVKRPTTEHNVIGTKWIFKNKQDENGVIIHNKARSVAQGYSQVEVLVFGETFAPVARLESIRILLDYAAFYGFTLHPMDLYKKKYMYHNHLGSLIPITKTMCINFIRLCMASNKHLVLGMIILRSFYLMMVL